MTIWVLCKALKLFLSFWNPGGGAVSEIHFLTFKIDAFVKSRISPPLVGGDKGEGDITT